MLGGSLNAGIGLGVLSSALSDKFGRKICIQIGITCMFCGIVCLSLMPEFISLIICYVITGFGLGLFQTAAVAMINEISAIPYRANFYTYLSIKFILGETICV